MSLLRPARTSERIELVCRLDDAVDADGGPLWLRLQDARIREGCVPDVFVVRGLSNRELLAAGAIAEHDTLAPQLALALLEVAVVEIRPAGAEPIREQAALREALDARIPAEAAAALAEYVHALSAGPEALRPFRDARTEAR